MNIIKEVKKRQAVNTQEIKRLTLKYRQIVCTRSWVLNSYYLGKLPKNSARHRIKNRCILTNRSKSIYRDYKLSRIVIRKLALEGNLTGVKRSSW